MRPTQRHFLEASAKKAHMQEEHLLAGATEYEKMLYLLARHKKDLKEIHSMELKAEYKKKILPDYLPWIEGALSSASGKQDNVLMTWLIWSIDCEQYHLALQIAEYAIHQGLVLPENFNRTLCSALVEEFADKAKIAQKLNRTFDVAYLERIAKLTDEQDMPDESRARLYREIGLLKLTSEPKTALTYLERALELNLNIGVQGEIKKLRKQLEQENKPNDQ
ncbi:terminase [Canicola haemoglobinophilus]|uniref:Phage small terminase subunit n=1 Tax=Canicola haemoglobinophilus TaxID=733 RepID=A0A1V4B1A9_9PAST|nr:phage terminase small subunit [Canicola haemoglobinophilus]OOS00658.1 terminase [Canicola haemoglobinophilus]STO54351.1 phage small terminase subunit [Canicola haemoglobinophilus]STO60180.1 phage small terminase subunit [Canicola haemoglobinophilus]STO68885.1 phage small terminase subunit [Canicola haemoglobinophilus]